ncbi:MAG: SRPBCC family protein [Candidatus Latescibacterota bacterium]|nr:MAG: SRPBCC family protein [Candidatus Latescibacterota bacterium]
MREFVFEQSQTIEAPIETVFAFFSNPGNLSTITPPWLDFKIETPQPIDMRQGLSIDYTLRIHGIPLKWQSEITSWDPPHSFVDEQRKGPYRCWIHEHRFESLGDATRIGDRVRYAVPGGVIVQRLFVARDIDKIFAYRKQKLYEIFSGDPNGSHQNR